MRKSIDVLSEVFDFVDSEIFSSLINRSKNISENQSKFLPNYFKFIKWILLTNYQFVTEISAALPIIINVIKQSFHFQQQI